MEAELIQEEMQQNESETFDVRVYGDPTPGIGAFDHEF